ncbi:MAG TPA: hypothetical protein VKP02_04540 [Gemmatimonadaceae bacterium]|nr:hypothetical protein [Gemmatimonadaceae bacterium]
MTTSSSTDWMNHPELRRLVDHANRLTLAERMTLVKGLVPSIADEQSPEQFAAFILELRLKGNRFNEAKAHPGEGRATRHVPGERDIENR